MVYNKESVSLAHAKSVTHQPSPFHLQPVHLEHMASKATMQQGREREREGLQFVMTPFLMIQDKRSQWRRPGIKISSFRQKTTKKQKNKTALLSRSGKARTDQHIVRQQVVGSRRLVGQLEWSHKEMGQFNGKEENSHDIFCQKSTGKTLKYFPWK